MQKQDKNEQVGSPESEDFVIATGNNAGIYVYSTNTRCFLSLQK